MSDVPFPPYLPCIAVLVAYCLDHLTPPAFRPYFIGAVFFAWFFLAFFFALLLCTPNPLLSDVPPILATSHIALPQFLPPNGPQCGPADGFLGFSLHELFRLSHFL